MQLTNGLYLISTIATSPWGERWVQRNVAEDKSLGPKAVAVQPAGVEPYQWTVEAVAGEENQYRLSASHGTGQSAAWTGDEGGKVSAALINAESTAQVWTLGPCEICDEGVFTVTGGQTVDGENGFWQTPNPAESTQITVENIIIPLIYPPQYPATVLFNFTQLQL